MNNEKLHARLRASNTYSYLKLRGIVDEDNSLDRLVPRLSGDVLVVDTTEVARINSCGVRDWVNWLHAVEDKGFKVVLIRCSPSIISQINLVTNFVGGAVVHSFYAPYYCESCDRELQKMIETESLFRSMPVRAPAFRCSDCGGALDFDDIEEAYFAFINSADPDAIDHRLKRLVEEVSPDLESKIRALNEAGSAPLSGPIHTVGGYTGEQVPPTPDEPGIPAAYLDIDEEEREPEPLTERVPTSELEALALASRKTNRLMILLVVSAVLVIGLLVYLALTGV